LDLLQPEKTIVVTTMSLINRLFLLFKFMFSAYGKV
jgi:hypothetical protein